MTNSSGWPGSGSILVRKPTHVDVDDAPVAEVVVAPNLLQQQLAAEHPLRRRGEFAQQPKLGAGEVDLPPAAQHHALVRADLQVADRDDLGGRRTGPTAPAQRADSSGQLLHLKRLGDVVVGACLQAGDHVMRVGARGDHDDRDVAGAAQLAGALEAVDVGQHQVDQDDVRAVRPEQPQAVFGPVGLDDVMALVLQRQPHRRPDAVVVFDQQNARHAPNMP